MSTTCDTPETATAMVAKKPRYFVDGTKESYEVRIELPGVGKDDAQIDLEDSVLTVKARRKKLAQDDWKSLHRELSDLDYLLRLKLNAPVDDARMTAAMADGILTLKLPLKEAAKPRRIEVK